MSNERARRLWKLACKWRRYRGFKHGLPGGINVASGAAMEASMVISYPVRGVDILARRKPLSVLVIHASPLPISITWEQFRNRI